MMTEQPRGRLDKPVVLVTGSTGLIGTRLTRSLVPDHTVVGLDIEEPREHVPGAEWFPCDLTNDVSVNECLALVREKFGGEVASVVHLAAYYDFSGESSAMYEKLTVRGTRRLLEGLRRFDRVAQFIFSSSLLVMKPVNQDRRKLTEDSPTRAEWDYPESKLRAERLIREERGEIPAVILRIAGVYDEDCHCLPISQQILRIYEKRSTSHVFPGNLEHGQPFVHLDDAVESIRAVIERRDALEPLEIFLIAEPEVMSYAQLQEACGELIHGRPWPTIPIPKVVAKAGAKVKERFSVGAEFIKPWMIDLADDHYPVEIRRAHQRLAWVPRHRLRKNLPTMIVRLMRDPAGWYETNGLPASEELAFSKGGQRW
jgi:nucleoside-diphosphate-sugar epimerase